MTETKVPCPICGEGMDIEMFDGASPSIFKGDETFARMFCRRCRLAVTFPNELRADMGRVLGAKSRMTVQSVQRQQTADEAGNPVEANQAIVTTDGPVMEALVDLGKIEAMCPGRSPLGALEDDLRLSVSHVRPIK